jgi:hypothetical protein
MVEELKRSTLADCDKLRDSIDGEVRELRNKISDV